MMLDMDKLVKGAELAQQIADITTDDFEEKSYNTVTRMSGREILVESKDVKTILENGKDIKGEIDLKNLASEVNTALGINESKESKTECEKKVPQECMKSKE